MEGLRPAGTPGLGCQQLQEWRMEKIQEAVRSVTADMIAATWRELRKRLVFMIEHNGDHVEAYHQLLVKMNILAVRAKLVKTTKTMYIRLRIFTCLWAKIFILEQMSHLDY